MTYAPSEDSDQPGHPPLATHLAHSEHWSEWADAHANVSLCWAHMPFCWFCHATAHYIGFTFQRLGAVARSDTRPPGVRTVAGSILTSGKNSFVEIWSWKKLLRPFSPYRWFKKGSCQLLAKESALNADKLPTRVAQEQSG